MKMELSQKDKKLLVFLSIFVIVVCIGYWGIYPIIKDINDIEVQMDEEEITKNFNEVKVAQVPMFETDNENMEQEILNARELFYPMMTSSEVDKYFTGLALDYNLYAYDLAIDMSKEECNLEPYAYSKKAEYDAAEDYFEEKELTATERTEAAADAALSEIEHTEDFATYDEDAATGIYTAKVTMKLGGAEADEMKLINDMSATDKKLRICSYSWSRERNIEYDENGYDYEIELTSVLTITMEIFMCEE